MEEKAILKTDLYSYLNIDIYSEEVALFNTKDKTIEDIYFDCDSLIIKLMENTIKYLNGATSIKEIDKLKDKKILSTPHIEYIDDFIIYKYKIEDLDEYLQIRCLTASLENSIKDKDVLLFYTYTMFFKLLKDITILDKDVILTIELIDGNIKEYKLLNSNLKSKNKFLKGYFKNELKDFNLTYNDDYEFSCHLYKDNGYLPFEVSFKNIEILK